MSKKRTLSVSTPPALEARGLTHHYPGSAHPAVDGLNLRLHAGEVFGLLGPNGAGKTTAIAILSTILNPGSGSVVIKGYDLLRQQRAVRRIIGLVPQEIALYPALTTRENMRFFGKLHGLEGTLLNRRIEETLLAVGLETRADQRVGTFSGGMKRRANLAVGILHQPQVLFLDEPTVGIDAQSRHLILTRIETLRDHGTTILYTTHYMEEAQRLCSRIAIMDQGRILSEGRLDQLLVQDAGVGDLGELFLNLTGKQLRDG
ncbi:ABC transporter ATP-binding protein [Desulfosarcina sp.]|uniref:ABC transporter ATP-binding protein n=1 Tax=Desulfosarcina sp. TaxID=2027861 RepID=UPI003970A358